jgi:Raf kinase inhibitor-like YbhB/YbcL family protein
MAFTLTSRAFRHEGEIPRQHTCEGEDVAPDLTWAGAPTGARSFALIVDDPDAPDPKAPKMTYVHWVVYDIPASISSLNGTTPAGAHDGLNDWKRAGYGGPCPPIGRHRYYFKLYALDTTLGDLGKEARKPDVEKAMQGHILGQATLMGTYEKVKR